MICVKNLCLYSNSIIYWYTIYEFYLVLMCELQLPCVLIVGLNSLTVRCRIKIVLKQILS